MGGPHDLNGGDLDLYTHIIIRLERRGEERVGETYSHHGFDPSVAGESVETNHGAFGVAKDG